MLKNILWLPILALACLVSVPIYAHSNHASCPCTQKIEKMKQLNLSQDQKNKIKVIRTTNKDAMKANLKQLKTLRTQINSLATADKVDESKLDDLIKQKSALIATMTKNRVMIKNQIFHVLNSQQQQAFQDMMKKWQESKMPHHCQCAA